MRTVPGQLAGKLYSAAEVIADRGLDNTKIEDIADAAGVPKATLYYYFAGKEEILTYLLNDMLATIAGEVDAALQAPEPARDRLSRAVTAQLAIMVQYPAVCRALVGDLGRATRLPKLAEALQTAFHTPIEHLLNQGREDGSLRPVSDPATTAITIFGAVTMAGVTASMQSDIPSEDFASTVLGVLLNGLTTAPEVETPHET